MSFRSKGSFDVNHFAKNISMVEDTSMQRGSVKFDLEETVKQFRKAVMKNLNSMFRTPLYLGYGGFLSCQNLEPRRPINKQKQVFLKESAENKNIIAIEQSLFRQAIHQDEKLSFESHRKAFGTPVKKTPIPVGVTPKRRSCYF